MEVDVTRPAAAFEHELASNGMSFNRMAAAARSAQTASDDLPHLSPISELRLRQEGAQRLISRAAIALRVGHSM
jgi:hypothetical protein